MDNLKKIATLEQPHIELIQFLLTRFSRSNIALALAAYIDSTTVKRVSADSLEMTILSVEWVRLYGNADTRNFNDVKIGKLVCDYIGTSYSTLATSDETTAIIVADYLREIISEGKEVSSNLCKYLEAISNLYIDNDSGPLYDKNTIKSEYIAKLKLYKYKNLIGLLNPDDKMV